MIPLTVLYDEYISIGQNCLNKKNPFEYMVPPLTSGVGTINVTKLQWFQTLVS